MAITIRPFHPDDAQRIAEIVHRCLREVNSLHYPAEIIDRLCRHYTAQRFIELSTDRLIYVAEDTRGVNTRIVGTVSRVGNEVHSMFVDPDSAGQGVGRQLMDHIEVLAAGDGHTHMEAGSSITAHHFYLRLGYTDVRETETDFGLNHIVRKPLDRTA